MEIWRKLGHAFIFRCASGTPRTFWFIFDFLRPKSSSRSTILPEEFCIRLLTAVKHALKQHRPRHEISASGGFERPSSRWEFIRNDTSKRAKFHKWTPTASVQKMGLKTRGHDFSNRWMMALKASSTDCGRISTTVFRLQFCILGPTLLGTFAALGSKYTPHLLKKKNSDYFLEKQRLPPGCISSQSCSTKPCVVGIFGKFGCLSTKKLLTDFLFF